MKYSNSHKSTGATVDFLTDHHVRASFDPCAVDSNWIALASTVPSSIQSFTFPDGAYSLKAVLNDNGSFSSSSAVNLVVDSVRPLVQSVTVPADTNGDGILNQAELQALDGGAVAVVVGVQSLDTGGTAAITSTSGGQLLGPSV